MHFKSDNIIGIHPHILQAIEKANSGIEPSYGADSYSKKLKERMSEVFEKDVEVFLVSTGTAANSLALSSIISPFGGIFCTEHAHIHVDECGAPEFFTGGAKLLPVASKDGKLNPDPLAELSAAAIGHAPHTSLPQAISISQATECGTVYTVDAIKKLSQVAKKFDLKLHMDGARFANGMVKLGCSPAEGTWKAGVDVLTFGATKNGALAAEAVVLFDPDIAKNFAYRHKRAGQLFSKMRFFAAQFLAYLEQDLWLQNAKHANHMALELKDIFSKHNLEVVYPVEANEIFVKMDSTLVKKLRDQGSTFYGWGPSKDQVYRFVTSCFTTQEQILSFKRMF